jgi:hypothetical protein
MRLVDHVGLDDPIVGNGHIGSVGYGGEDDYIFPSVMKIGSKPISPDILLKRRIRPALERLKITKKIGWHSFRFGFSNLIRVT